MATQTGHLIQDQNLSVHCNGAPEAGGKINVSKAQKNGGLGRRKALNDISNSGKPSAFQASKKFNSKNMISIGEDSGASKPMFSVGEKTKASKDLKKMEVGGRKALSDLTNSGKPFVHQLAKNTNEKKLSTVTEEEKLPSCIMEEKFLHNHQECIKAQRKSVDMGYFLKAVGLDLEMSLQLASPSAHPLSTKLKPESPQKHLEMEQMPDLLIEDQSPECWKTELCVEPNSPPLCGSSESPKWYMQQKDYNFPNFTLIETPKLPKH